MKKMFVLMAVGVCCSLQASLTQFASAQGKVVDVQVENIQNRFVIGVSGEAIEGEDGVVIRHVAEDSPAATAGVKVGDIVLRLGNKKVKSVPELSAAVQDAGEKEAKLQVMRDGKKMTLNVTPTKSGSIQFGIGDGGAAATDNNLQFMTLIHPGVMLNGFNNLPKGVEVRVVGQGDKPAKMIIAQGDKEWETEAHKMHELPQEAKDALGMPKFRGVGQLFRGQQMHAFPNIAPVAPRAVQPRMNGIQVIPMPAMPQMPKLPPQIYQVPQIGNAPRVPGNNQIERSNDRTDEQFKKLEEQIQAIQEAIEELQESRPAR